MNTSWKTWFQAHGLALLIAAQPLLDALAFWTANEQGTAAGYIRLLIMAALPLWLLIRGRERRKLLIALGVMALYALLHVLNNFRVGAIAPAARMPRKAWRCVASSRMSSISDTASTGICSTFTR